MQATALLVAVAFACAAGRVVASPVEAIELIGLPLSKARSAVLAEGWRPLSVETRMADGTIERQWGNAGLLLKAGYPEVELCSGTGRNICIFNYQRGGICLRLTAAGEFNPGIYEPKVVGKLVIQCSSSPAQTQVSAPPRESCVADVLAVKPPESGVLRTRTSGVFQALGQDFIDYTTWRKNARLEVCREPTRPGDSSKIYRLRNLDNKEELVVTAMETIAPTPASRPPSASSK